MKTRLITAILAAMVVASSAFAQTVDTAMTGGVSEPYGIAVDSSTTNNYFYITDSIGGRVVRFTPATGEQKDLTFRIFSSPQGIVLARGGLAVAEFGGHRISFVNLEGEFQGAVGTGTRGFANGPGATAQFDFPAGLATDAAGNLYVADSKNNRIRRIAPDDSVTTYGPATDYLGPEGIAVDEAGRVFVADTRNHVIRMISADGATVTTIAGELGVPGTDGGFGLSSRFNFPKGLLWIGGETGLLVADTQNQTIRRVYKRNAADTTWLVGTYAGMPGVSGFANGSLGSATFFEPTGLGKQVNGLLLVVDLKNDAIRRIIRSTVTTPTFNYVGGSFSNVVDVRITNDADIRPTNSVFRFTTDGSDPVSSSPVFPRTGSVTFTPPAGSTNIIFKVLGTSPDAMAGTIVSNFFWFFVNPPTINVPGGAFTNDVSLVASTFTDGATLRYTTDGSFPDETSPVWVDGPWGRTGPLVIRGFRSGFADSAILTNSFTFTVATPEINREEGIYFNAVTIEAFTPSTRAQLYYTLDGSEPTTNSIPYAGSFQLDSNLNVPGNRVLRMKGFVDVAGVQHYNPSDEVRRTYTFVADTPTSDVAGGSFTNDVPVNIATITTGAALRFTTDGTTPTDTSPLWVNGPFGTDGFLQVRAFRAGFNPSTAFSGQFNFTVVTPVLDVASGVYSNDVVVTVTGGTAGALYRYTLDGTAPTAASPTVAHGGKITVSANAAGASSILTVVGVKPGYVDSAPAQANYTLTCDPVVINQAGGSFLNNTNITLTTRTTGATIRFTTDGSLPTESSPVWTDGSYGTDGVLTVRVFKAGYNASGAGVWTFAFTIDPPTVSVPAGTYRETFEVVVASRTADANFHYTLDGTAPTTASPSVPPGGTIPVTSNARGSDALLTVLPFKAGYAVAPAVTWTYVLQVANPVVSVPGGSFINDTNVNVTVAGTTNVTVRFTNDGSAPTAASPVWSDGAYGNDGPLAVRGFRDGFNPSELVQHSFTFTVDVPVITPGSSSAINTVTVDAQTATAGATLRFTTDGSAPTVASPIWPGPSAITTNAAVRVAGFKADYRDSSVAAADYTIQVDAPLMNPNGGYFPDGSKVTLSVTRPDGAIHYTVTGVDPTEIDPLYTGELHLQESALAKLRARAFAPNTVPSAVTVFTPVVGDTNTIGVARDVSAGAGSTVLVPIVVNLRTNVTLRSLQYRVEVWPAAAGIPNLTTALRVQAANPADFAPVVGSAEDNEQPTTLSYGSYTSPDGVTNGLVITALGTNANFLVRDFATVALVVVPLPATASLGHQYLIRVVQPSGTSDGLQDAVPIGALPPRNISIAQIHYIVGDTSPGRWYNAGDFGNGDLDNADVNNAFYASLGVRVPFPYTDAFDAMDAYPDDTTSSVGGDGQIRFLDWQRILFRSLRQDTNNWERYWSATGVRVATNAVLGAGSPDSPSRPFASGLAATILQPEAQLAGAVLSHLNPGATVRLPVHLRVAPGKAVTGVQFRAVVEPAGSAPALDAPATFASASGLPQPLQLAGLALNQTTAAWSELVNPLTAAWQGDNLIGHVVFTVPARAAAGDHYRVRFLNADGAPNLDTQYDIETVPGIAAVQAGAVAPEKTLPGVRLQWFGLAGQRYAIESTADISSPTWQTEASGLTGQGRQQEYIDQTPATRVKFYRVRLTQ